VPLILTERRQSEILSESKHRQPFSVSRSTCVEIWILFLKLIFKIFLDYFNIKSNYFKNKKYFLNIFSYKKYPYSQLLLHGSGRWCIKSLISLSLGKLHFSMPIKSQEESLWILSNLYNISDKYWFKLIITKHVFSWVLNWCGGQVIDDQCNLFLFSLYIKYVWDINLHF